MENALENKAKFFALYWGQEILKAASVQGTFKVGKSFMGKIYADQYLILKPLSSISDEDLIQVSKYIGQDRGVGFEEIVKRNVFGYMYGRLMPSIEIHKSILVIDFLRSRGYALPWMGLSVEEQVNRGWVKLKGETK